VKRILIVLIAVAAVAVAATVAVGSEGSSNDKAPGTYTVELDNAFGLTQGADVKIAGVRAGTVTGMRVDPKTTHALIDFQLNQKGFQSLRSDAFCETRPQSLIGEYFVDCRPGTSSQVLRPGSTIPIAHTASTVPADLLGDIMRLPYRERLRIIVDELGAGVGGRAGDLNSAIRRAVPALRETDQVLAILARQNHTLADLTTNADTVIGDLAANRKDVGRFVVQANKAATASAERRNEIRASLQKLPTFLNELTPTMASLGRAADTNTPSLQNLNASASQLATLFRNVPSFADASLTGLKTLAKASRSGRPALVAAKPTIAQLGQASAHIPEVANNLAIILQHMGDRKFAVEKDPRSPGGQGYTGLEAILQYLYDQTMAINIYDAKTHILKVDLFANKCSNYQNLDSLKQQMKTDPSFFHDCAAVLGPNLPGITQSDPTATSSASSAKASSTKSRKVKAKSKPKSKSGGKGASNPAPGTKQKLSQAAETLRKRIEQQLGLNLPSGKSLPAPALPSAGTSAPQAPNTADPQQLLNFLLGP
jgi:virulence factor Mce-like protein